MISIIRYTLITALRDLLFIGLLATVLLAIYISNFLGGTALAEQEQMTLSYLAGSVRLIVTVGLILFVCFHVRRSFDNKEIEVIISKPISRGSFILAYWLAFALLSVIVNVSVITFITMLTKPNSTGLLYWGCSLLCEGIMVVAFAMLSSLIMRSAVASALSSLCFYIISRMMGFFVAMINQTPGALRFEMPNSDGAVDYFSNWILYLVSTVLPRLDLFAKSSWLIYGVKETHDLFFFPLQSLVYIPFLLAMALYDFRKKQF